jgi:lipoyl(octanoyl) transferase
MQQIGEIANEIAPYPSGYHDVHSVAIFGSDNATEVEIVCHKDHDPQGNMDVDHFRALAVACGEASPMLRLYSWKPFAVSLGAHQRETDLDAAACAERGFAIVRRPTGGRAILHAAELTYSVVVPLISSNGELRQTSHDVYRRVHLLLLEALISLGIHGMDFEKTQPNFRELYRSGSVSMPCFASSARYELVHNGRKIVGSAQKLYGNGTTVLQHGSLLLNAGHERLAEVLNLDTDAERATIRRIMQERTATLSEIAERAITFDECADAIVRTLHQT